MRITKMDCTLNEKDTLCDLLNAEKQLMGLYTTALFEGSTKSVKKALATNLLAVADDQFCLFTQLKTRGYVEVAAAPSELVESAAATFKKQKKSLKQQ